MLNKELNFDINKFISLNNADAESYLKSYTGFNTENLELLANILFQIGLKETQDRQKACFEKSLQIYQYCNLIDKTYSFEREDKIILLKKVLNDLT